MGNFSPEKQAIAGLIASAHEDLNFIASVRNLQSLSEAGLPDPDFIRDDPVDHLPESPLSIGEFDPAQVNTLQVGREQLERPVFLRATQRAGSYAVAKYTLNGPAMERPRGGDDRTYHQTCDAAVLLRSASEEELEQANNLFAPAGFRPLHVSVFELYVPAPVFAGNLQPTGKVAFLPGRLKMQPVRESKERTTLPVDPSLLTRLPVA